MSERGWETTYEMRRSVSTMKWKDRYVYLTGFILSFYCVVCVVRYHHRCLICDLANRYHPAALRQTVWYSQFWTVQGFLALPTTPSLTQPILELYSSVFIVFWVDNCNMCSQDFLFTFHSKEETLRRRPFEELFHVYAVYFLLPYFSCFF